MKCLLPNDLYDAKGELTRQVVLLWHYPDHWLRFLGTRLTTKSLEKGLPQEIWNMVASVLEDSSSTRDFSAVTVRKVLRDDSADTASVQVEVDEIRLPHGRRKSAESQWDYDEMLADHQAANERWKIKPAKVPRTVIVSVSADSEGEVAPPVLLGSLTSPDIISRLETRECWFCGCVAFDVSNGDGSYRS